MSLARFLRQPSVHSPAQMMQVVMRTLSSKTIMLEVEGCDTVASDKRIVAEGKARLPARHCQHLVYDGRELPDNRSLEHCYVRNERLLHLYLCLREAMQVLVRTPYYETIYLEKWVGDMIISTKRRISLLQKVIVSPDQQYLTFTSGEQVTELGW